MRTALSCAIVSIVAACSSSAPAPRPQLSCTAPTDWTQAGRTADHTGTTCASGRPFTASGSPVVVDPFLSQESAEASQVYGEAVLLAHFQAPLTAGDDVYVEVKGGTYASCSPPGSGTPAPCGIDAWTTQTWGIKHLQWSGATLVDLGTMTSDWKPPPNRGAPGQRSLGGWEPLFHAALSGTSLWMPGVGGSALQFDRTTGQQIGRVDPFGGNANTYVTSPVTVAADGDVFYTAMTLDPSNPWGTDAQGYLVRVGGSGLASTAAWPTLVPGAPAANAPCETAYNVDPGSTALPLRDTNGNVVPAPTTACGSQRPALNAAPAVGPDGTIFVVGRAHLASRYAYVVALDPATLAPKWAASLRNILADGCGVTVPMDGRAGNCFAGAPGGVDPLTGTRPAGIANDDGTSSPVALPDGSVLYGAYTSYNGARGHLFKFSSSGTPLATYDFGWDITPAWFPHDGTYSIVLKDNVYGANAFYLTQLDANLHVEWKHQSSDNFEWCVNAVAVDKDGVVYANSEDGNLYAINPGGDEKGHVALGQALGAAYTPITLDAKGRIYAQNAGKLYVFGGP
jgi:hypothetical protein